MYRPGDGRGYRRRMTPRPSPDPGIGGRIRARRLTRGWSVRFAASRAGLSHATWSRIERGLQAADNRFTLAGIAEALERDREAIRLLLAAERIAPQHVHRSTDVWGTVQTLLDRSRRQSGGTELRGLSARMQAV
jgi:transcriptional regulator with XRE-family HTH domain